MTGQQERLPLTVQVAAGRSGRHVPAESARHVRQRRDPGRFLRDSRAADNVQHREWTRRIALFDPRGETRELLSSLGIACRDRRSRRATLPEYDILDRGQVGA